VTFRPPEVLLTACAIIHAWEGATAEASKMMRALLAGQREI
jgi:hypothetical protein